MLGPGAGDFLRHVLTNDVAPLAVGGAQYAVLCRRTAACSTTSSPTASAPSSYLTVTNAANHETDFAWFAEHADGFDVEVVDAPPTTRCSPSRGRSRARSCRRSPTRRCRRACTRAPRVDARPRRARLRHRLHRRGRRRAAARPRATRRAVWDELVRRGARPGRARRARHAAHRGLLPLYGNELSLERGPIEAGLGWCCTEATGFIGSDGGRGRARGRADREARRVHARAAAASRARATRSSAAAS